MNVRRAGRVLQAVHVRHPRRDVLRRVREDVDLADDLGFLDRLGTPRAGVDVVRDLPLAEEVHRDHGELLAGAALQEQDRVVVAQAEQFLDAVDRFDVHRFVVLAAVAVLHDRHARALEFDQFGGGLLEDFERKNGGTCVEIIDS